MSREKSERQITLDRMLRGRSVEGELYRRLDGRKVECFACAHRCVIQDGLAGICLVRYNEKGVLFVPRGYVTGLQCDPIEKKPFYHALAGTLAFSFGMLGCDYHCPFCQNWITSQALRDPVAGTSPQEVTAEQIVDAAVRHGARSVSSTYNEPLITTEWAVEIFRKAREEGLYTSCVSNGNASPEALDYLRPWLDLCNVDLKGFRDSAYRELGGTLQPVLDTIRSLVENDIWVEVITLVVPGHNDDEKELRDIAGFLAATSRDIPWHVTAFHPDYKMTNRDRTTAKQLLRACEIGREEGLRYVYAGNLPGVVGEWENTACPGCGTHVIERRGFHVRSHRLKNGCCPSCGTRIAGFWDGVFITPERPGGRAPAGGDSPES